MKGSFFLSIFFSFFGLANILKSAKKFCIRMKNTVSYYICVRFVVHFLLNYQKRNFEVITFSSRLLGSTLFEAWGEIECCWWKKKVKLVLTTLIMICAIFFFVKLIGWNFAIFAVSGNVTFWSSTFRKYVIGSCLH